MHPALQGLTVLERGWLSSNNIVIHGAGEESGAVLVDTGHVVHAEQTVALLRHALRGERLLHIVNTHLHSDHCGGNAAVQRAFGAPITVPPGNADAVAHWDRARLTHATAGQSSERFRACRHAVAGAMRRRRRSTLARGRGARPRPAFADAFRRDARRADIGRRVVGARLRRGVSRGRRRARVRRRSAPRSTRSRGCRCRW